MNVKIVYGPPGTGKTHALINILDDEVSGGTPMSQIAYVAFSKKAAYEAQDRIRSKFLCSDRDMEHIRTIHSMAFKASKANATQMMSPYRYRDFGTKSGFSLKGYYSLDEGFTSADDDFIALEQLYRNNRKACDKILDNIDHRRFITFIHLYGKYKNTFKYLDFTDLLSIYIQKGYTEDVKVAIIDEAQDLTTLQWQVVMQAFRNVERMYIAGDDMQAIFTWAGADIDIFLRLTGDTQVLEYSYRMPQLLVMRAQDISNLVSKKINKAYHGEDREAVYDFLGDIREHTFIPNETYYLLARNNYHLKIYIDHCLNMGVRFKIKGVDYLSKTDINRVRSRDKLNDWDPEKVDYVNRLILNNTLLDEPLINISTIHAVKGGEADNVIIMSDVSRGVAKQLEWDEDSEHRCMYVAVSRAKKRVYILMPTTKYNYPYFK